MKLDNVPHGRYRFAVVEGKPVIKYKDCPSGTFLKEVDHYLTTQELVWRHEYSYHEEVA